MPLISNSTVKLVKVTSLLDRPITGTAEYVIYCVDNGVDPKTYWIWKNSAWEEIYTTITDQYIITRQLTGFTITGGTVTSTDTILSAFGKLQNQLNAVASPMVYQGTWNANTNFPTLTSSVGTKGHVYRVTTSGATNIDGTTDWKSGDFIVFNGTTWDKWDSTDAVTSVNGYVGNVVLVKADVDLGNVPNVDATNPANIVQNTNYRFVTDTEKTYWNGKQDALGYVPEDVANKATTMTGNTASNVKYLTSKAVYDWGTSTFIPLNAPIVGATKTKITYDSKGLVTAGADATTADIADSLNKRYVTDANLIVINNTSNTNTGDETQTSIKTKLGEASATQDGYLSAFYWSAFNNKQSAISLTNIGNSGAASFISNTLNIPVYTISGLGGVSTSRNINTTAPLQGGGDLSADRTLSITQATISSSGYLSSTDWNIFNDKQNALSGGILNRITKWTSTTGIGNSQIADDGTSIAIGASLNSTVQLGISTNKATALKSSSSTGIGINGLSTNSTGGTGVKGESTGGYGLFGISNSTTVDNVGVYGSATDSISLNIGGKFVAGGISGSKYSIQLQDGTENTGKFLKSITADGKANWANIALSDISGAHTGTGTANYITKWTDTTSQGDSGIFDNGTNIGIGTNTPTNKLHVSGSFKVDTVGTISTPANTLGWYRLATSSISNRGAVQLTYSTTGGNYAPVTFIIKAFKDYGTVGTIILEKYGTTSYIKRVRLIVDEIDSSVYHIEGEIASNPNGLLFNVYVQKTLGYESTWNVNLGTLSVSTSTATPIRQNNFIANSGGISSPSFQIQNNVLDNLWEFRDGSLNSAPGVLNLIGSSSNIIMSWDDTNTRVGIGLSSSPSAKLHINNITTNDSLLIEDSTRPDGTPFVIDNTGNVGVGLTTPATLGRLVVQGNGANGLVLNTDSGTATNSTRLFFRQSDGNDVSMFNVNGSLRFLFNGTTNNTSGDSKFVMTNTGSLLINATSPIISPVAPLTAYATGTVSAEEVARFAAYDVNNPGTLLSSYMSIRNGTSTDSEFIPQLRGLQATASTLAGLDLISLVPDTATTNASFLIRATNTSGGAIINRPSFEIRNAASVIMGANYNTTYSNNYIGFGHNSPTAKVHVRSGLSQIGLRLDKSSTSLQAFEFLNSDSGNEINSYSEIAAAKPIIISNTTNSNNEVPVSGSLDIVFNILGNRIATIADTGNVGIGVNAPSTKLHINSATSGAFRLVDTTQGASKYLKSDTNGVGTWSALSVADTGLTITTTGTSGPATLVGNTLNIPQYSGGGGGSQTLAQTLALGNTTGTNDVILSSGTFVKSPTSKFKLSYDETNNQAILLGSNVDGFGSTINKTFTLGNGTSTIINQENYSGGSGYRYGKLSVGEGGLAGLDCYQSSNNGIAQVTASTGASNDPQVSIAASNNSGGVQILVKNTIITVENPNTSNPGIEYVADYSANFTARTLVDKAYVDTAVSTVTAGSASSVSHTVKAGIALTKGQAVYVSSADGTNMIVSKADYSVEPTSSKTMGLIAQNLSLNGIGQVITEGLLAGLNTSTANAGDPVWLGDDGNLLYGLANKPSAPNHMVFIGIVTRANINNGEIFVKPQNGFELSELHDVQILTEPHSNETLTYDTASNLWKPSFIPPIGDNEIFRGRTFRYDSTTVDTYAGLATLNNASAISVLPNTTNFGNKYTRLRYYASIVSTGRVTSIRSTDLQWYIGGGFRFISTWRVADTAFGATCQNFHGLISTVAEIAVGGAGLTQVSTLTNCIFIGSDGADVNLQVMHNDAVGTCTKIDLGAGFPSNRTAGAVMTTMYSCEIYNQVNSSNVKYRVINLETGEVAKGIITTNLPATTQGLAIQSARVMGSPITNSGQWEQHKWGCSDITV